MSSSSQSTAPLDCGKRLLSQVIDERARSGHARPFASIPVSNEPRTGYRDISYGIFANAINRLARWILDEIGEPRYDCESLVYIAPADLRYQILMIAASKVGYIACLVSPRNSAAAFAALLEECNAQKFIISDPPSPAVSVIRKCRNEMREYIILSLDHLLDEAIVTPMPVSNTWEQYRFRPFVKIHTSGSTGTPKLITLKHGSFSAVDGFQLLQDNELHQRFGNMRMCVTFPPFHIAGITYSLASPIWVDSTIVLPPPAPLTADLVNEVHVQSNTEFTLLPPSLIVDLANDPSYLHNLTQLNGIAFSGGPLPEATGKKIAQHTRLLAGYGATEWNAVPQLVKPREDWAYFRFNEKEGGLEFRKQRSSDLYEMVITRRPQCELSQPVFVTFPDLNEFHSRDLFAKHHSKPGLWKYVSRLDDIIVLSNGEKLNPVTFEGLVATSPDVTGCVVIGQGRFQASLLVEPKRGESTGTPEELIEKIWSYVEKANEPTVRHGRVTKDAIFFTTPEKPLPRAGKGTIQRAAANALYADEIDEMYNVLQTPQKNQENPQTSDNGLDLTDVESSKTSLLSLLKHDIGIEDIDSSIDFFALGMDSLQVVNLVRAINTARPSAPIDAKQVYDHPSITQLARSLHAEPPTRYLDGYDSDDEELKDSWLAMDDLFNELTVGMAPQAYKGLKRNMNGWLKASDNVGPVVQPDGGRVAWLQVFAMFLVNINNWGLVNSFGVFQAFYEANFLSDYAPSSIAWIGTLQGALLLLVGVISGPLFDKGYFKPTLIAASIGLVFALMMLSLSTKYYQIFLTQGVLCGICSGLLYIPSVALVPVYFKHRRGLALGLATGGGSFGGVLYPIIFRRLLSEIGFKYAVIVMGSIALLTLGSAVVLSKPLGPRVARQLFERGALAERPYVFFLLSAFFLLSGIFVPFFLATSFSLQSLNVSPSLSFYLISIINAAQFFGRLVPAAASDFNHRYFGPEAYHFLAEIVMVLLAFSWIAVHSIGGFVPWLIVYGFFSGAVVTLPPVIMPYICPNLAVYGTRLGMFYSVSGLGFLISLPIATAANSSSGGFLGSQIWTGVCCSAAASLFVVTGLEVRKRRLLYEKGKTRKTGGYRKSSSKYSKTDGRQ